MFGKEPIGKETCVGCLQRDEGLAQRDELIALLQAQLREREKVMLALISPAVLNAVHPRPTPERKTDPTPLRGPYDGSEPLKRTFDTSEIEELSDDLFKLVRPEDPTQ